MPSSFFLASPAAIVHSHLGTTRAQGMPRDVSSWEEGSTKARRNGGQKVKVKERANERINECGHDQQRLGRCIEWVMEGGSNENPGGAVVMPGFYLCS